MRSLTALLFFFSIATSTFGQAFTKSYSLISAGYGFSDFSIENYAFNILDDIHITRTTGPVFLKYEHGLTEHLGMGINFAILQSDYTYSVQYDSAGVLAHKDVEDSYLRYSVLARLNYHFGTYNKFDPYIGMSLGYRSPLEIITTEQNGGFTSMHIYSDSNIFGFELTLGARYFISKNFGLYTEFGLAKAPIQAGLVLKFPAKEKDPEEGTPE